MGASCTATESLEAAGVRAGDSVAAVGSMYAFSSGWATTEAPNVVPWLEDMVEMCMFVCVMSWLVRVGDVSTCRPVTMSR